MGTDCSRGKNTETGILKIGDIVYLLTSRIFLYTNDGRYQEKRINEMGGLKMQ